MSTRQVRDDAHAMQELLDDPKRWCKDALEWDGAFCLLGARIKAAGDGNGQLLWELIQTLMPGGAMQHEWNNAPERTHDDIRHLMKDVVAEADRRFFEGDE